MRRVKTRVFVAVIAMLLLLPLFAAQAQDGMKVEIKRGVICRDVIEREPVGVEDSFPKTVKSLYCFTEVYASELPTEITHAWFFKEIERARVTLPVRGTRWRTKSSKRILTHEIGPWRVDIIDATGEKILSVPFSIVD